MFNLFEVIHRNEKILVVLAPQMSQQANKKPARLARVRIKQHRPQQTRPQV